MNATELSGKLAFDANSLNQLKRSAQSNSPEAIKAAAKQFEAVFLNMVMKSMREASPQDGPFDSEQSRTFTAMLDQQLSNNLAQKGVGLADILTRQLSKTINPADAQVPINTNNGNPAQRLPTTVIPSLLSSTGYHDGQTRISPTVEEVSPQVTKPLAAKTSVLFQQRMAEHAEAASQATGIPAHLMLGQAALESGWGKREIKAQDGTNSHNLFGIKATGDWKGKVVATTTTEYVHGVKQTRVEKFRAYDSYAESFKDFAHLIQSNPRYRQVMDSLHDVTQYARAMQTSGYATDPHYASKLAQVINQVSA